MKYPRLKAWTLDPDKASSSGDRGTPHITRADMMEWIRSIGRMPELKHSAKSQRMVQALVIFIQQNGGGGSDG